MRARKAAVVLVLVTGGVVARAATQLAAPSPFENPPTEAKRLLGKMLFWDEQLSADDTIACGSCHTPDRGGSDPRRARNPGPDGIFGTADDVFGSPGVVYRNAAGNYAKHAVFGFDVQVTGRSAPSFLTGALADSLFWDGRATSQFVDPQTGLVAIGSGGALESQAVGPVLNSAEMGREGRTWDDVATKLATAAPLALSTDIPPDVAAALTASTRYPELFAAAFGDGAITAQRVAFAVATYERTLVPDATPWDRFMDGDASALTAAQQRGWGAFQQSHCIDCHKAPEFTDRDFHDIGLRPATDDAGRNAVTGVASDRGRFRTPSLRNTGLRVSHMHTGQFTAFPDILRFYARAPGSAPQFTDNLDPIMAKIQLPPQAAGDIQALLETGLTDPRAQAEQFPFDYPTPYSESRTHGPSIAGAGRAGAGGTVPKMIAVTPPYLGSAEFRLGVANALGGAQAFLAVATAAPVDGQLASPRLVGPVTLTGTGAGGGTATVVWPLPDDARRAGEGAWFQWRVVDPSAPGGVALSPVAAVTFFAVKSTSAATADATDDADLLVDSAQFAIDWRSHAKGSDADTFSVAGTLAAASPVAGETFVVSVGGTELVRAELDAAGRARSAPGVAPKWNASVDARSGRFTVTASGADLRSAVGLDSLAGGGTVALDVTAALGASSATAAVPFAWRTKGGRLTRGTHRFSRDGLVSGAFLARRARFVTGGDGTTAGTVGGSLDAPGAGTFVPSGDLTLTIGGEEIPLSASLRSSRGGGASPTVSYDAASVRFTYSARTRTFSLTGDRLAAGLLPDDGSLVASVPFALTTSDGLLTFTTTIVVRRSTAASKQWRR